MKKKKRVSKVVIKENILFFAMSLPVFVLMGIFSYWPMFGIVLPFKDYNVIDGILFSPWSKPLFKNFEFFLTSNDALRVIRNTLLLNLLFIAANTFLGMVFALFMYEVKKASQIKLYQTVAILPNFLSWIAISYIVYALLDMNKGAINRIITSFGGEGIAWYLEPQYWPAILCIVFVWHGVGMKGIMYYASLIGIDTELYEAAEVDGATTLQKTRYISIPHLVPLTCIMVIMNLGAIFRADFGLFYNVTRNVGELYPTTDVMDTYVFRALMEHGNIPLSSAGGIIQSVVCTATLLISNAIVRKVSPENSLF